MDQGDRDLGSAGIVLLDDTVFKGKGVARMAIACGKNSVCYVVNRDNLGGYMLGTGGGDAIIQSFTPPSNSPPPLTNLTLCTNADCPLRWRCGVYQRRVISS
jgi:hypothetical protein